MVVCKISIGYPNSRGFFSKTKIGDDIQSHRLIELLTAQAACMSKNKCQVVPKKPCHFFYPILA